MAVGVLTASGALFLRTGLCDAAGDPRHALVARCTHPDLQGEHSVKEQERVVNHNIACGHVAEWNDVRAERSVGRDFSDLREQVLIGEIS